ncbi:MAG: hypothetical protein HUU35_06725 [Armatimonadetes bacterium]|nr:hypothetical protein [Armatimonadota bacterium]
MHGNQLHSCANCWFNGLQAGSVGLSLGYCTEYQLVLRQPDQTTCGRHTRVDLTLARAAAEKRLHQAVYSSQEGVQRLSDGAAVTNGQFVSPDTAALRADPVGAVVADYGEYGAKIESLAQLRALRSPRAELAMLSLGRAYVDRCMARGGLWTSGLHLLWWTRQRLTDEQVPELAVTDLRYQTAASLERQLDLSRWWLLMLRLVFISDLGAHSLSGASEAGEPGHLSALSDLAEQAAAATQIPSSRRLATWVRRTGAPLFDRCLPETRYRQLASALHRD